MSFLSFGKKKEQVSLVVDIGNSSITSALVLFEENNPPVFLYVSNNSFDVKNVPDSKYLLQSLNDALETQFSGILKNGFEHKYWTNHPKNIQTAIVSVSSPWFFLKSKQISISNEKDFIVSDVFLDDVVEKESLAFEKELSKDKLADFCIIEKNILHTKVNGYTLNNPIGNKTKNLDAFLSMSAMDAGAVNLIYKTILKNLHIPKEKVALHTFPVISFDVIRDYFSAVADFLIMDITGDMTDITLVQDSVITGSVSMPSGKNFLLRQISRNMGVSIEIAESILHMYISEKVNSDETKKIREIITQIEKEWAIYFENALIELSPNLVLPSNLFLMSDSDVSQMYENFIKMDKIDTTSNFRKVVDVKIINETSVSKFYKNEFIQKADEFIVFVALFYKKILNIK